MDVLWRGEDFAVRDVQGKLGRPIAYTTVMTVMTRLAEKGLLSRVARGRAYVYRPKLSKQEYAEALSRSRVRSLIDDFGELAIAQFAEELEQVDPERAKRLGEMLTRRRS